MRNGKVIGAFGIHLSPLLVRSGEILALAQKHLQVAEELRGMKAYIQKLRGECLSLCLQDEAIEFVEAARNFMRRTGVAVLQASSVISRLKCILQSKVVAPSVPHFEALATANDPEHEQRQEQAPSSNSNKTTASDGQNVQHKESQKSCPKKALPRSMTELWACLTEIPAFSPDHPTTEHGLLQLLFEFGKMLRIDSVLLGRAVSLLGLAEAIQVADQMACKIDQVKNPDSHQKILREHGLKAPMSGKGNSYDNAAVETFFKTIKAELIWRRSWETRRQAETAFGHSFGPMAVMPSLQYINGFYNPRRRHSALGGKSPLAFECQAA